MVFCENMWGIDTMRRKERHKHCDHLGAEVIRRASKGDKDALGAVIARYQNYGRKCLMMIAGTKYNLDVRTVPVDDLMQIVLMRLMNVIVKKYEISE